jgi:cytochrome c
MLSVKAQFEIANEPPDEGRLHLFPFFLKGMCLDPGVRASNPFWHTTFAKVVAMKLALWVLAVLAVGACAAQAQDPASRGRALVREFCSPCHAIGKSGNSPHKSAPPFRTLGRSFDLDQFPRRLERGISSGHPDMPEFKFSGDDARAVRDYLRTIQQ